ncbi:prefoldin subunit 4 isoform X3 [Myotis daubentonii]|uniref:prefoldin subunit 4 isoform X3 n=1 Tax=Myotis daubentonii TaxID=98922 RepID=UPI002872EF9C|nr:prefoldin subunit 4 isoform X3 [Myotis daubentonii]
MAATMKKAAAEDVNVTFEDQQKINKFARNTSRITELKEEIDVKKKQLQNLEDACEDIMLTDEDCLMIPYQIGDVFISHSQEETQDMLEEAKLHSYLWAVGEAPAEAVPVTQCLAEVADVFMEGSLFIQI